MAFTGTEWKPTKLQALFASLPWSIKEAFFGGAAGGGKSDILLVLCLLLKLYTNPAFKQLFTRRTYKELKLEIVPRSRDIYRRFGATFNQSDMAWTFPRMDEYGGRGGRNTGAMVFLGHCEHEKDVHNYDGMEINIFSPDELTSFTQDMYMYIAFTRVRTSDPTLPAIIRGAGMPGGPGHIFVKKRFVDPAPEGSKIILGKAGLKRIYIHASAYDNPHVDPNYIQSINALPEAERRAKLGDWDAFEGAVFDEFREFHYPDEPENALHVIEPFEIPAWWPRIYVGDWGMRAMTWIGCAAISPTGRVYLYREFAFRGVKIADWTAVVRPFLETENVKLIKFCQSAGQDRGQEHTIQEQISEALGRPIELTVNKAGSRVSGKMLIHEYLRWRPKAKAPKEELPVFDEQHAMHILRVKGQKAYQDYLNIFVPEQEEVLPKLLIFKGNPEVVSAIKAASYDPKKVEDIAEFDGDDPLDGLRYLVDAADSYTRVAVSELEKVKRQEQILTQYQQTKDMTALYRNMRAFESRKGTKVLKGIRRFH